MPLPHGVYDRLVTAAVQQLVRDAAPAVAQVRPLDADESADRLADLIGDALRRILGDAEGSTAERVMTQIALVNGLLSDLRARSAAIELDREQVVPPPSVLEAVHPGTGAAPELPETGLALPWLFTAGRGSPALVTELRREAAACEGIDILVSFITVSGVRKLIDVLRAATAAGATGQGRTRIRVLTTTYTGATEIQAIDELARLNGCEVRISLDGRRTRLHAKAWIFHRLTGFGSAYVGSANLSGVTLDKSAGFHDRIAYHDYAVSPGRFHWQSQNAAGPDTPTGRRYLESATNGWCFQLFVRPRKGDAYRACGPVYLADRTEVTGERPMNITWTLRVPLPPRLFAEFSVLRR